MLLKKNPAERFSIRRANFKQGKNGKNRIEYALVDEFVQQVLLWVVVAGADPGRGTYVIRLSYHDRRPRFCSHSYRQALQHCAFTTQSPRPSSSQVELDRQA